MKRAHILYVEDDETLSMLTPGTLGTTRDIWLPMLEMVAMHWMPSRIKALISISWMLCFRRWMALIWQPVSAKKDVDTPYCFYLQNP